MSLNCRQVLRGVRCGGRGGRTTVADSSQPQDSNSAGRVRSRAQRHCSSGPRCSAGALQLSANSGDALQFSVLPVGVSRTDVCRICYKSAVASDPLVSVCSCKGSIQFLHVNCLKSWVDANTKKVTAHGTTSIHCKSFACDICRSPYPRTLLLKFSRHKCERTTLPFN